VIAARVGVTPATVTTTQIVPIRDRLIRPPDPMVDLGKTVRIGRYSSAAATRILLDAFFRDTDTCIDLTWGQNGGCWKGPLPPGLTLVTNNIDPKALTDHHVDFTATGFADRIYGVPLIDPPHLPYLAPTSFMAKRYGTASSRTALWTTIQAGVLEAWRIADVGIIVKLTDFPNGGAFLQLTSWAKDALGVMPCYVMHTHGRPSPRREDEVAELPRNNGADWLVFRRDGGPDVSRYPTFSKRYTRQEASRLAALRKARRCAICDRSIGDRRNGALTCSLACRKALSRRRAQGPAS
jgi:hypothetical protein